MIARWQEKQLISALKARRAVHLTGARQCGKSTLANAVVLPETRKISLDRDAIRKAAFDDPEGFVTRENGETIVIDEIQKVPELLNAIKVNLDSSDEKGQYLLTGSSNLRFAKAVKDSLAGRMRTLRLRTLTLGEILGGQGTFIAQAVAHELPHTIKGFGKRDIIRLAFAGGYPEARELAGAERRNWFEDYLEDLLVKDISDVTEIRKLGSLRKVAEWLLAHSSKFFDVKDLGAQAGISVITANGYIAALEALYLFDSVKPWSKNDYAKIGRREKRFASDPSLVANLLGWDENSVCLDPGKSGKLVETWAYHEISALADLTSGCKLTQYRDSNKREIDFVLNLDDNVELGIEVKSGSLVSESDFLHLKWFARTMAGKKFTGIVLYSGDTVLRFGDGFFAVPLAALGL